MTRKMHYQADVLERFIPVSLTRLVTDLLNTSTLNSDQRMALQQFCTSYTQIFHAQAHTQLQHLKSLYHPYNPDRETLIIDSTSDEQILQLKKELYKVLEKANYERISEADLNEALNKISPHGVKVSVDFDDFAEVALFYRGSAIQSQLHWNWRHLSFKKQTVDVRVFRRLFILLQPKSREQWIKHYTEKQLSLKQAEKKADAAVKNLSANTLDKPIFLKLFKDIPRADLEMLFPNTRIQIRLLDKIKLGVMGGGGTAGGVMATIGKFSTTIDPVSALIAIGGLLGVIWRQIAKIFTQRAKYSAILTKNLYFYSLDNNMGALTYLLDSAEAEECKEAILAYFFLLTGGEMTRRSLDQRIENHIQQQYAIPMDFEIDDGLDKLQQSGLLIEHNQLIKAIPVQEANRKLQQYWHSIISDTSIKEEQNHVRN